MNNETVIRDFHGRIIGYIQTDKDGNKRVLNFHRQILGDYKKSLDVTRDFYGRIIARGDQSSMLIGLNNK